MNALNSHQARFLKLLAERSPRFLIVGGWAVNLHGAIRPTEDLDVWIPGDQQSLEQVYACLLLCGMNFSDAADVLHGIQSPRAAARIHADWKIDLLRKIDPLTFSRAYDKRASRMLAGILLPVIALDDLIESKRATNIAKDARDVERLNNI
jgi:hypothetical protein